MAMRTRGIQNQILTELAWRMGDDSTVLVGNPPFVCLYLEKGANCPVILRRIWLLRDGWGQLWVSSLSTKWRGGSETLVMSCHSNA